MSLVKKSAKIPRMVLSNKGLIVDYDALKSYIGSQMLKELLKEHLVTYNLSKEIPHC
jgi:hypothetical protein